MNKFITHMENASQQVAGAVSINLPELPDNKKNEEIARDVKICERLDGAMEDWANTIKKTIDELNKELDIIDDSSASQEITFWRKRNTILSNLHQQFQLPDVKRITTILNIVQSNQESISTQAIEFSHL
jgi:hypothetical protein